MTEHGLLSVAPALFAIAMAFLLRRVAVALLSGVLLGAAIAAGRDIASIPARVLSLIWGALSDGTHLWILSFALLLGGLMGLLRTSGGSHTIGLRVAHMARSRRGGQLVAWCLGLVLFFDDYANTLFVGSSMGPATRRLRISREKLAFIVDATAAPVASIAPVSSWIAVELGYIADQLSTLQLPGDAYGIFLATIPQRFYPLLMLAFGLMVAASGRDLGPMASAEQRAYDAVDSSPPPPPPRGQQATQRTASRLVFVLPVVLSVCALGFAMYWTGRQGAITNGLPITVRTILQFTSSSKALVAATAVGGLSMLCAAIATGRVAYRTALSAWLSGLSKMLEVALVLLFAWSLGAVCAELQTARYLVTLLGRGFSPEWLPCVVFLVSAVVSFATGTSWGTMGIVFPLAVPLANELEPGGQALMISTMASVLSGSVFGDHCSPISDTTIMSALATDCDQLAHVRTQLPYALLVAAVSMVCGSLPVSFGLFGPWLALCLGCFTLAVVLSLFGRLPLQRASS